MTKMHLNFQQGIGKHRPGPTEIPNPWVRIPYPIWAFAMEYDTESEDYYAQIIYLCLN